MPGQESYVSMPDGSYVHIPGDATPDQLSAFRTKLGGASTPSPEAAAAANPPVAKFGIPKSSSEMIGEGEEAGAQGNAEMGKQYVQHGPMEVGRGLGEIGRGDVAHGIHRAVGGAQVSAIPAAAATLPMAAMAAPLATAGGAALGAIGPLVGKYGGRAIGLTPDQSDVAGDALSMAGGWAGAKAGGAADSLVNRFEYRPPESLKLPWGLGKIAPKGEPEYPAMPLPMQAHAEMQADLASARQGRAAAYGEMQSDIGSGQQERSAARSEMYDNLAKSRMTRTGNPAREGQQVSEGHSTPIGPSAGEFYENRSADLAKRTGDVETEGQQSGGIAPISPRSEDFYENRGADLNKRPDEVTQAVREGRAARLPMRVPKSKPLGEVQSPFSGMMSTSPAEVSQMPEAKPTSSAPLGQIEPTSTGPPAKISMKGEKPTKSLIVQPGSEAAKPPHVEGSYWSFKEPALRQTVLEGDRDAAIVYKQRFGELPPGARYMTDVAASKNRGLYRSEK